MSVPSPLRLDLRSAILLALFIPATVSQLAPMHEVQPEPPQSVDPGQQPSESVHSPATKPASKSSKPLAQR